MPKRIASWFFSVTSDKMVKPIMNQATFTRHDTPKWLVLCLPHVGVMNLKSTPPPIPRHAWPNTPSHLTSAAGRECPTPPWCQSVCWWALSGQRNKRGLVTIVSPAGKIPRKDGTWKSWVQNPCSSANVSVKWIDDINDIDSPNVC
jgi:hypothetical protein